MNKRFKPWLAPLFFCLGFACQNRTSQPIRPAVSHSPALPRNGRPGSNASLSGRGTQLNFALYINDAASQERDNVVIGPDGRVSYLQSRRYHGGGINHVDELRAKMDAELGKYYRLPRTIITPVTISSKKYFVLPGSVVNRGVFTIDRPLTVS